MRRGGARRDGVWKIGALGVALASALRFAFRRARRISFAGKVVLVTGGSRGLGLLLAEEFGRRGARVALCGRDPDAVRRAVRLLAGKGIDVYAESVDLAVQSEAEAFVDRASAALGPIDVLVNNAGIMQVAPLENQSIEEVRASLASNLWSAVHVTLYALPDLRAKRHDARIVNVVSIGGRVAVPHMLGYATSKFAFMGFSEALRAELAPSGVAVTTVVPSPMRTGSIYNAEFSGEAEREFAWFSLLASLPFVSISAKRAARRIVRACAEGRPELHLGLPARLASLLQGVAPALTARLLALQDRLLPAAAEHAGPPVRGRDLRSPLQGSLWLTLGDRAAARNNESPPAAARG